MVRFYTFGGTLILVVYIKDGVLYVSVSFDCGQHFIKPIRIGDIKGSVKDIQILSRENQFVIAVMEAIGNENHKRAISGWVDTEKHAFFHKECSTDLIKGSLLSISLGFRKYIPKANEPAHTYESVDYKFVKIGDQITVYCCGHGGCQMSDFIQD
ncbi:MAG: hypothetical protein ABJB85_08610 [Nitrososphaerota archaeon]